MKKEQAQCRGVEKYEHACKSVYSSESVYKVWVCEKRKDN